MAGSHKGGLNWQISTLPRNTKKALDVLGGQNWLKKSQWYLAGGTALALQVGHRQSMDLDFFNPQKDFSVGKLLGHFKKNEWQTDLLREGTIYGRLNGSKVSFIAYPFFVPRKPFHQYGCVRVLDVKDIAVMKIIAISQRGRKRDFVDLYWHMIHNESLMEILRRLPEQYPAVTHNYHHILKALEYFADADGEPMPRLFFEANWKEIKKFFRDETLKAAKQILRLDRIKILAYSSKPIK